MRFPDDYLNLRVVHTAIPSAEMFLKNERYFLSLYSVSSITLTERK